ncbi:type II toxin-antitoxin system Phd/YefM family antitoxin [Enterococcus cecorum]|nr:type II toxin-antitoxin system prevent-host-death family antitoxin [Enterococcus cecorum]CAI3434999.1 type II toxin-antitoxin system Phd/YefM family antitoxin [Enterococcus cecorum]
MKKVNDDVQRVVVTTNDESDIEVMGKAVYDSWQETLYLMQSKVNRQRLDESVIEAENSLQNLKEVSLEDLIIDEDSDV